MFPRSRSLVPGPLLRRSSLCSGLLLCLLGAPWPNCWHWLCRLYAPHLDYPKLSLVLDVCAVISRLNRTTLACLKHRIPTCRGILSRWFWAAVRSTEECVGRAHHVEAGSSSWVHVWGFSPPERDRAHSGSPGVFEARPMPRETSFYATVWCVILLHVILRHVAPIAFRPWWWPALLVCWKIWHDTTRAGGSQATVPSFLKRSPQSLTVA